MHLANAAAAFIIKISLNFHTLCTCKSLSSINWWSIAYEMQSLPLFTFFGRQEARNFKPIKPLTYHIAKFASQGTHNAALWFVVKHC